MKNTYLKANINGIVTLGEIIMVYRKRMGLSQEELAEMVGVSVKTMANYESGRTIPQIDKMMKIANVLKIPDIAMFCEPDDIKLNLYGFENEIIMEDGRFISDDSNEITSDIFKLYNCKKFEFACIESENKVYLLTTIGDFDTSEMVLARFLHKNGYVIAEFDGKEYKDIRSGESTTEVENVAASILGVVEKYEKIYRTSHKHIDSLI